MPRRKNNKKINKKEEDDEEVDVVSMERSRQIENKDQQDTEIFKRENQIQDEKQSFIFGSIESLDRKLKNRTRRIGRTPNTFKYKPYELISFDVDNTEEEAKAPISILHLNDAARNYSTGMEGRLGRVNIDVYDDIEDRNEEDIEERNDGFDDFTLKGEIQAGESDYRYFHSNDSEGNDQHSINVRRKIALYCLNLRQKQAEFRKGGLNMNHPMLDKCTKWMDRPPRPNILHLRDIGYYQKETDEKGKKTDRWVMNKSLINQLRKDKKIVTADNNEITFPGMQLIGKYDKNGNIVSTYLTDAEPDINKKQFKPRYTSHKFMKDWNEHLKNPIYEEEIYKNKYIFTSYDDIPDRISDLDLNESELKKIRKKDPLLGDEIDEKLKEVVNLEEEDIHDGENYMKDEYDELSSEEEEEDKQQQPFNSLTSEQKKAYRVKKMLESDLTKNQTNVRTRKRQRQKTDFYDQRNAEKCPHEAYKIKDLCEGYMQIAKDDDYTRSLMEREFEYAINPQTLGNTTDKCKGGAQEKSNLWRNIKYAHRKNTPYPGICNKYHRNLRIEERELNDLHPNDANKGWLPRLTWEDIKKNIPRSKKEIRIIKEKPKLPNKFILVDSESDDEQPQPTKIEVPRPPIPSYYIDNNMPMPPSLSNPFDDNVATSSNQYDVTIPPPFSLPFDDNEATSSNQYDITKDDDYDRAIE